MAKFVVLEFMTVDGVVEAPENWQFQYISDDLAVRNAEHIHQLDAQLIGRHTYETFAPAWTERTNNEFGIADKFNEMPKYVVSTTMTEADWNNSHILRDMDAVRQLKQEFDGIVGIIGSTALAQSIIQAGLVDEYQIQLSPHLAGTGQRLFDFSFPATSLQLVDSQVFERGAILLIYRPV